MLLLTLSGLKNGQQNHCWKQVVDDLACNVNLFVEYVWNTATSTSAVRISIESRAKTENLSKSFKAIFLLSLSPCIQNIRVSG